MLNIKAIDALLIKLPIPNFDVTIFQNPLNFVSDNLNKSNPSNNLQEYGILPTIIQLTWNIFSTAGFFSKILVCGY